MQLNVTWSSNMINSYACNNLKISKLGKTEMEHIQAFLPPLLLWHFRCSLSISLISPAVFYLLTLSLPLFAASILIGHVFASAASTYWSLANTHTNKLVCTHILTYMNVPFLFPHAQKHLTLKKTNFAARIIHKCTCACPHMYTSTHKETHTGTHIFCI